VTASLALATALVAASGFVTVNGHRMYYKCTASGRPTVGSPDTATTWRWVQPRIARFTRVCAYLPLTCPRIREDAVLGAFSRDPSRLEKGESRAVSKRKETVVLTVLESESLLRAVGSTPSA